LELISAANGCAVQCAGRIAILVCLLVDRRSRRGKMPAAQGGIISALGAAELASALRVDRGCTGEGIKLRSPRRDRLLRLRVCDETGFARCVTQRAVRRA
jgi:hypothetical protein